MFRCIFPCLALYRSVWLPSTKTAMLCAHLALPADFQHVYSFAEQPTTFRDASKLLLSIEKSLQEVRKTNALDNFCGPPGSVVAWNREQLHVRWIHPSSAGARFGGSGYPAHHRAKSRIIKTICSDWILSKTGRVFVARLFAK
jgi:hypothetical protein